MVIQAKDCRDKRLCIFWFYMQRSSCLLYCYLACLTVECQYKRPTSCHSFVHFHRQHPLKKLHFACMCQANISSCQQLWYVIVRYRIEKEHIFKITSLCLGDECCLF